MVVPQLSRCRQCKAYLQGTRVEGFIFEQLVPEQVHRAPGTATLCLLVTLYYALMVALAGPDSFLGFSPYTLQALGAVHAPAVMLGQYWRFATSIFSHHDLLHLAMNLSALVFVGELVERMFDRKKMLLIYLVSGVASMAISYGWSVLLWGDVLLTTMGASGAICGLIGAALVGAKRRGPEGAEIARAMWRWAILLVLWGLVPRLGINNAAHAGGFAVGALLAWLFPVGLTRSVPAQKVLSVATLLTLAGTLAATLLMVENLRGYPVILESDENPRTIMGFVYNQGSNREYSDQKMTFESCADAVQEQRLQVALDRCELNLRINPAAPPSYELLASLVEKQGDAARADRLRDVGARIQDFMLRGGRLPAAR